MNLKTVEINDFRSIKHEIIDFSSDTCKVLVGINEAGKSNILKAISSLNNKYGIENIRRAISGEDVKDYSIIFSFLFTNEEKNFLTEEIKKLFFHYNDECIFMKNDENLNLMEFINSLTIQVKETSKKQHEIITNLDDFSVSDIMIHASIKGSITQSMLPEDYKIENIYFFEKDYQEEFYTRKSFDIKPFKSKILSVITNFVVEQSKKLLFWEFKEGNILPGEINHQNFLNNVDGNTTLKSLFEIANKEKTGLLS